MLKLSGLFPKPVSAVIRPGPAEDRYYMPLESYAGEMELCVEFGDQVKKFDLLAKSEGHLSSCIHSPVSGKIEKIEFISNKRCLVVVNDYQETERLLDRSDLLTLDREEFLNQLKVSGIEGLGGAQFPAHAKYNFGSKNLDLFIINGVECEPFLSADYALMSTFAREIISALEIITTVLNPRKSVLALKKEE